jgi:hypothetical protein
MRHKARGHRRNLIALLFVGAFVSASNRAVAQLVKSVETVGMTVVDMDRSVEFFSKVLTFEKTSDIEVYGAEYEKLQGVFGLRMRVVRMKLGAEAIELTQYLAPEGRPIPPRLAQQRPLVSACRHRRFRHGQGL